MPKIRVLATLLVGLFLFVNCSPETPKFALKAAERRGTLKNGLRFVVMPDPTTQLVEVDVHYDVGAREDPPGKSGLAHLVEHLMFQARPDGPDSAPLFKAIMNLSTTFNAFTVEDFTHYMTQSRADRLDDLLKIESMRMFFGCQTIPKAEFEREREVVRNEIRAQSTPEGQIQQLLLSAFYPKGHAYERTVGGNDEQIASATLDDACEFMKKYYAPERAIVIVAGGIQMDDAIANIEKWFARIPARTGAPRVNVEPFQPEHATKTVDLDVERSSVNIAWALPAANTPEGQAARFGLGPTIEKISRAGQEYGFAYDVQAGVLGGQLAPVFFISIDLKGMDKLDEALDFAKKSAAQAYRGFDMASYDQAQQIKSREKARFVEGLEALNARTVQMGTFIQFDTEFDFKSAQYYQFHELDKIEKFDIAKVGAVVKKALDWEKSSILVVKANKEGIKGDKRSKVAFQTKSDTKMDDSDVDPADAFKIQDFPGNIGGFPGLQQFTLGNGMKIMLLPIETMPLATAELSFRNAGTAADANSPMLGEAAADYLFLPMDAEAEEASGTQVRCRAGLDEMFCSTRNINVYLDVMLRGLDRQIHAGEYNQAAIEDWQKRLKDDFATHQQQEDTELARQVYTALFGPDHPYTKSALETPDAASKVHRDALDAFRKSHYTAANATLVVVGKFDPKYATKLVKDIFGGWDSGQALKPVDTTPAKRTGPIYVGVVGKEVQQLTVEIAYPAPAGIDGQEGARRVLANMLNTRVEDIRFKLGSTYGVYMGRQAHLGPTAYRLGGGAAIGGTIDAERAGESLKAIRESFDALRSGDHFNEDFVRARRTLIASILGQSTVTGELAARLDTIAQFGLDASFYNKLLNEIGSVPPALVKALLKTELDPKNEIIVILGDKPHLEKAFAEAGIKDVKFVEPEYRK